LAYNLSAWNISTIGQASNPKYMFQDFKKAGNIRNLGKRPVVRGVAMIHAIIRMVEEKAGNLPQQQLEVLEMIN